jgi:tetratricopeptide (TPR) repeat protein
LPELPAWASQIKIINLLQYTSGLPDVKWKSVKNDSDNMTDLQKVEKLDFEPGSSYAYNNNNVFIQRRIIEKITGLSFKEFVVQKLLKPCGMKTAIVDPDNQDQLIARAYDNSRKEDDLHVPISGWTALTLDDFYKWAHAITSFKLISPESSRELLAVFGPNKQSGLGGGSMDGYRMVFHKHDGTARNYQALLISNVLKGRTVILMTNNQQNNLYAINASIQSILDGKPYVKIKKSVTASFSQQIKTMNGPQVLEFYEKMKKEHGEEYNFEAESTLNEIGYMLMNSRKIDDAVLVFEYNTKLFPESGNVYDSLGEAYYALGNKEKALQNYTRSLQLDPTNEVAKKVIAELNKK